MLEKQAQEKILQLGITLTPQGSTFGIESFKFAIDVKRLFFSFSSEATSQTSQKPHKRRVLLLKRKAVTTGIFDSKGKDDVSKGLTELSSSSWSILNLFASRRSCVQFTHRNLHRKRSQ